MGILRRDCESMSMAFRTRDVFTVTTFTCKEQQSPARSFQKEARNSYQSSPNQWWAWNVYGRIVVGYFLVAVKLNNKNPFDFQCSWYYFDASSRWEVDWAEWIIGALIVVWSFRIAVPNAPLRKMLLPRWLLFSPMFQSAPRDDWHPWQNPATLDDTNPPLARVVPSGLLAITKTVTIPRLSVIEIKKRLQHCDC